MKYVRSARSVLLAGALFFGAGCASEPELTPPLDFSEESSWPYLERVTDAADMPDFRPAFLDRDGSLAALDQSIVYLGKPSSQKFFPYRANDAEITHERMLRTLTTLRDILQKCGSADEFQGWCLYSFDVYASVGAGRSGRVLFTAYCEPIFDGRLVKDEVYRYPLYVLPTDLEKDSEGLCLGQRQPDGSLRPYPSRQQIEQGNLLAGYEFLWLKDPFDVYIAQVQGSARINLPDGRQLCIGYAGKTQHEYTSIGQVLIQQEKLTKAELSLTRLKQWFAEHPEELQPTLWQNSSFVFFRECEPGPWGCLGSKVTAFHSVATDKDVYPRAAPCLAVTRLPVTSPLEANAVEFRPATNLLFDQDRGGAIKAAGRADIFIGTGPEAERLAGFTQEEGRFFYFFAKQLAGTVSSSKPDVE